MLTGLEWARFWLLAAATMPAPKRQKPGTKQLRQTKLTGPCYFLDRLPLEIRNEIYQYLFIFPTKSRRRRGVYSIPDLNILRTSKRIFSEASHTYYTENSISLFPQALSRMLVQLRRCQRLGISYVVPSLGNFAIPPFALDLIRNLRVNLWIFSNADQRTIRRDFAYLASAWKYRDDINRFEIDIAWKPLTLTSFEMVKEYLEPLKVLRNIKTVALSPVMPQPVCHDENTYCEDFKKLLESPRE